MTTPQRPATDSRRSRARAATLEQLWTLAPHHCLILTDPVTRRAIDVGLDRAEHHGFRAERDLSAFVSLMVGLGAEFDEDPQLPWVQRCLQTHASARRGDAMSALVDEAADRMDVLLGPEARLYRDALAWARDHDFEVVADFGTDEPSMHELVERMYPKKYALLDSAGVDNLVARARFHASKLGLDSTAGSAVVLQLMVLLGSGITRDPFHPWVADALATSRTNDPSERTRRLHAEGLIVMARYRRLTRAQQSASDARMS